MPRILFSSTLFSSTLMAVLSSASAARADTTPPKIVFEPCHEFQRARPLHIYAAFEDESPLFEPKLFYRARAEPSGKGAGTWKSVPFGVETGALWKATIPARDLQGTLEYFVETFDENGNGPARAGSPEAPFEARAARQAAECAPPAAYASGAPLKQPTEPEPTTIVPVAQAPSSETARALAIEAPPPERSTCDRLNKPFYCKAWFWAVVGGAVATGAGVTTYFALRAPEETRDYPATANIFVRGAPPTNGTTLRVGGVP